MRTILLLIGIIILSSYGGIVFAQDFSSSNFTVTAPVINGGAGYATSSNFGLWSSISQPAIGESSSSNNTVQSGFLYFSESESVSPPPPPPPPPPTPPAAPSGGGGGAISPVIIPPIITPIIPIIPPIIDIITGGLPLPTCEDAQGRSDFNCDGEVDLKDLSILLTQPRIVTARVLSFLFNDWTRALPVPTQIAETNEEGEFEAFEDGGAEGEGLAEVTSTFPEERKGKIVTAIKNIFREAGRIIWRMFQGFGKFLSL